MSAQGKPGPRSKVGVDGRPLQTWPGREAQPPEAGRPTESGRNSSRDEKDILPFTKWPG